MRSPRRSRSSSATTNENRQACSPRQRSISSTVARHAGLSTSSSPTWNVGAGCRTTSAIYVIVNLPDFMLYVIQNGRQVWSTKIVDGKPETPTPIMTAEMRSITINPTWNIPDTIACQRVHPVAAAGLHRSGTNGLDLHLQPQQHHSISQPPGPENALGQLRFNFPTNFSSTRQVKPKISVLQTGTRQQPRLHARGISGKIAEVLLAIARPREGYTENRIRSMFGTSEIEVRLPTVIPVHVTYQTAFVDRAGKLQLRDDMYGRDKTLLAILKGDERKIADIAIERKENTVRREALAVPDQFSGIGGGRNIFSRLFGLTPTQPETRHRTAATRTH